MVNKYQTAFCLPGEQGQQGGDFPYKVGSLMLTFTPRTNNGPCKISEESGRYICSLYDIQSY